MTKTSRSASADPAFITRLRDHIAAREKTLLADLRSLVEIESPSDSKPALDACGQCLRQWAEAAGARVQAHPQKDCGDHLEFTFPAPGSLAPLLLLGHFDTVWPPGTLAGMPFQVKDGRAWGPGVFDMKAGIVFGFHALAAFMAVHGELPRPIKLLLVSDEEVGSTSSRPITEKIARQCAAVYVLEPAQGKEGAYKTWRKGICHYELRVAGQAAHAGVDFGKGASAILEMSRQIERISALADGKNGITVNVGTIRGGTRSNVVAAECVAEIDLRVLTASQWRRLDRKLRRLRPFDRRCRVEISGGMNRPPMERSKQALALFAQAHTLARALGVRLMEAGTGGGSDGNFTAALGIPTLDGMGAVGEGAHAVHESILLEQIVPRTALLAGMLQARMDIKP